MKYITILLLTFFLMGCAGTWQTPPWAEGVCLGCSDPDNPEGNGGGEGDD